MRSQIAWLWACSCALALAGCGGDEPERRAAPPPRLPPAVAERLAVGADDVAARIEASGPCGAAPAADSLRADAIAAVNTPAVPADLKEELLASVQELHDRVTSECAAAQPPPPPPPPATDEQAEAEDEDAGEGADDDGDRGKEKGKGKAKGRKGEKGEKRGRESDD